MKRLSCKVYATTLALASIATSAADAQAVDSQKRLAVMKNAERASALLNGTWVLKQRTNPNGKPHQQPLKGEFTVSLPLGSAVSFATNGVGVVALGSYRGVETGVMDGAFSDFSPGTDVINPNPTSIARPFESTAAAPNRNVLFEMNGRSELALEMSLNDPNSTDLIFRNLELKGTYGVFRQGVRGERVPTSFSITPRRVLFFRTGTVLQLKNTFGSQNLAIPAGSKGPGSPSDKSHDIVKHVIMADRMEITYGNGGHDLWIRRR